MSVYPSKIHPPTNQLIIRAVFPTGPYGDLRSEHAYELERLLTGAQRHALVFHSDGCQPQLHATAWLTRSRSHARGLRSPHRPGPVPTIVA